MTVFTATRALARGPSATVGWAQDIKSAWGTIDSIGSAVVPAAADTLIMCKLPKGALVVGGALISGSIDNVSVGSGLLSLNIGIDKAVTAANGTAVTALSTSNCLANAWVLGSDVLTLPGGTSRNSPLGGLLATHGPLLVSDDANAYITITASAFRYVTTALTLRVDYYMGVHA